jgi:hypothetical protein
LTIWSRHRLARRADARRADARRALSRARPYKSNDNAHVEQKNGDIVRRHAFHYRYDTALELQLLDELCALVRIRFNMFTATKKAIGWRENRNGHKTRRYDKPRTPYQRVIDAAVLTPAKSAELAALFSATNPADLTRGITDIQLQLISLAGEKTQAVRQSPTRAKIVRHAQAFREHLDVRHSGEDTVVVPAFECPAQR